jgi:flagellar biosynthesis protein FlhG
LRLVASCGLDAHPEFPPRVQRNSPFSVAVLSGKGGVGKSSLITNLAVTLAEMNQRVLLLDGDWGLGNVDQLLGLTPRHTLHDVLRGRRHAREILLTGPAGIRVLPGASGSEEMANLDDYRCETLLRALRDLLRRDDLLLIDTGSGLHRQSLRLAQTADAILVLTTPEPTACADTCAVLRALATRRLARSPGLVVNQARSTVEARAIAHQVCRSSARSLGFEPELVGVIPTDEIVRRAVQERRPFVQLDPDAPASRGVRALARRMLSAAPSPVAPVRSADTAGLPAIPARAA